MARRSGNTTDPGKNRSGLTGAAAAAEPPSRRHGRWPLRQPRRCPATRQTWPALAGRSARPRDQGSPLRPLCLWPGRRRRSRGAGRHHLQIRRQRIFRRRLDARHVRAVRLHGRLHVRAVPVRQDRGQEQAIPATACQDRGVAFGHHRCRPGRRRDEHRPCTISAASGRNGVCSNPPPPTRSCCATNSSRARTMPSTAATSTRRPTTPMSSCASTPR